MKCCMMNFENLGLSQQTIKAIDEFGIKEPTTVQADVIPSILEGKDVFTIAPQGCGKTMSYVLPLIDIISTKGAQNILIITPNSECSVMTSDKLAIFNKYHEINNATIKISGAGGYASFSTDAGGIVGYASNATINACINKGVLTTTLGNSNSQDGAGGGIVGNLASGTVSECYNEANIFENSGMVSGGGYGMGTICGRNNGTVINCYNTGDLTGNPDMVGLTMIGISDNAKNCYTTGTIVSYAETAGSKSIGSNATNSYRLTSPQAQSYFSGWDFDEVWCIDSSINDGYPYLRAFYEVDVTYQAGQGTGSEQTISYDKNVDFNLSTLQSLGFSCVGHTFAGWLGSDGVTYSDGQTVNLSDNLTLTAQWAPAQYTITYRDQGNAEFSGVLGANSPTTHTYNTATTLIKPTKNYYTFGGWFDNSTCTGNALTTLSGTGYTSNITLYAKWTAVPYTITYYIVTDGVVTEWADSSNTNTKTYTVEDSVISFTAPTAPQGYAFAGWSTTQNGQITQTAPSINVGSSGNKTYYAHFNALNMNVTINCINYANQHFMIYVYSGDELILQIAPTETTSFALPYLDYASNKYSIQFVCGYYSSVSATGDNIEQDVNNDRIYTISTFNSSTPTIINFSISTPNLGGIIII